MQQGEYLRERFTNRVGMVFVRRTDYAIHQNFITGALSILQHLRTKFEYRLTIYSHMVRQTNFQNKNLYFHTV